MITTSRDGSCKIWRVEVASQLQLAVQQQIDLVCVHTFSPFNGVAVTAVDVHRPQGAQTESPTACMPQRGRLVALGAETGELRVVRLLPFAGTGDDVDISVVAIIPDGHCHGATVRRVRWRPRCSEEFVEFATCGEDKTVRVHRLVA